MKRIIWSRFPFATFKTHYFSFGMKIPSVSRCEWLTKIFCQVINISMSKSSRLCFLNGYSIESNFIMRSFVQINIIGDTRLECDTLSKLLHIQLWHVKFKSFVRVAVLSVPHLRTYKWHWLSDGPKQKSIFSTSNW